MEFFILVEPWTVYVKEGNFFREQNGPSSKWGERWERVEADSIEHARLMGEGIRVGRFFEDTLMPVSEAADLAASSKNKLQLRTCGVCGIADIPFGIDWPWWKNGNPVHSRCLTLSFADLRKANLARVIVFKNAKGELSHGSAGIDTWSLVQWSNAMAGEGGEAAVATLMLMMAGAIGKVSNLTKKIDRGDFGDPTQEQLDELGNEIADVIIYADLLAARAGLDLGECVRRKFNIVSDRVGATVKL